MSETYYKIRRKSDGKFSKGGYSPSFTKQGKSWHQIGWLHSHLTQSISYYNPPENFELVTFEVVQSEVKTMNELRVEYLARKAQKEKDEREREKRARVIRAKSKLKVAQQEYEFVMGKEND